MIFVQQLLIDVRYLILQLFQIPPVMMMIMMTIMTPIHPHQSHRTHNHDNETNNIAKKRIPLLAVLRLTTLLLLRFLTDWNIWTFKTMIV